MVKNISIITLITITIIAIVFCVYFCIDSNKKQNELKLQIAELEEKNNTTSSNIEEEKKSTDIPINDLFGVDTQDMIITKIVDGDLYYWIEPDYDMYTTKAKENNFKKIDSNVKRIKTVSISSDTKVSFLIIKKDGSVYVLTVGYTLNSDGSLLRNTEAQYKEYLPLKDKKVDDIRSINTFGGSSAGMNAEIITLDGKIEQIQYNY